MKLHCQRITVYKMNFTHVYTLEDKKNIKAFFAGKVFIYLSGMQKRGK